MVQEDPRGSLSIRPKGRRDTSSLNQTIGVRQIPHRGGAEEAYLQVEVRDVHWFSLRHRDRDS